MKRYITYILLSLITFFAAVSCIEEMESPLTQGSDQVTIVPRVTSFTNQYVTKAYDAATEGKINKLAVLVFNNVGDGELIYFKEINSNATSVSLNKSMFNRGDVRYTIVMMANMDLSSVKKSDETQLSVTAANKTVTLDDMENYVCHFGSTFLTSVPDAGFPMIGGVKNVDLRPASTATDPIQIDLKILFAKVNLKIKVEKGAENSLNDPEFKFERATITNLATATPLAVPDEVGVKPKDFLGNEITDEDAEPAITAGSTSSTLIDQSDKKTITISFSTTTVTTAEGVGNTNTIQTTFYIAENRYNHGGTDGIYPDALWNNSDLYNNYKQQYKPKLATKAGGAGLPTFITLTGQYTDYRSTQWGVKYTVYLGKNNYDNFHIDRNSEYTNTITIKGIRNNDDYGTGKVWLDHRVDVTDLLTEDSAADRITITRETLIDAHIEVRPLRVSLPSNISRVLLYLPKYDGAQVNETKDGTNQNWIAVENNNGRLKDVTRYSTNGKRKYFTTSLIKELYLENNDETYGIKINSNINDNDRKGQKYIQLFNEDCAWVYIDENTEIKERTAQIDLVFYNTNGNPIYFETITLRQNGLQEIRNDKNEAIHYIEKYEEYLHTYDSQDLYTDPTKDYTQRGYKWGYNGIRLSNSQRVGAVNVSIGDSYLYDYFHATDKSNVTTLLKTEYVVVGKDDLSDQIGLNFTNRAGIAKDMSIVDMNTKPSSAIQYCLSKNKFNVDESNAERHTMDIHWYLPDSYEMMEILSLGNKAFTDFKNNSYWTSQPSWTTGIGAFLYEDVNKARTVSLGEINETYQGTNINRDELHRIRCAYSANGIQGVDFSGGRAPEGIGAMHFYMRAWKDWSSKEPGYFGDIQEEGVEPWLLETKTTSTPFNNYSANETFAFPVDGDDADEYTGVYAAGYGFRNHPREVAEKYTEKIANQDAYTSYVALNKWPGLTTKKVVEKRTPDLGLLGGNNPYYVLEGDKLETSGTSVVNDTKYNGDIMKETLLPLDHLLNGNDLTISFIKGANSTNSPKYEYSKINYTADTTTTRTWSLPIYKETPKIDYADYNIPAPGANVNINSIEQAAMNAAYKSKVAYNSEGYIYHSDSDAIAAAEKVTLPTNAENVRIETDGKSVTIYTYQFFGTQEVPGYRYRYVIHYQIAGQKVMYYLYQENTGKWTEKTVNGEHKPNTDPPTDQFLMYGGNSFKIKANNGKKISSIKVHYSGSNVVKEDNTGTRNHYYLRFTKDGYISANNGDLAPGMVYSADGSSGTMEWSGEPQEEVLFKLVVYHLQYSTLNLWGEPNSIKYIDSAVDDGTMGIGAFNSYNESIIIDQIDVRYQ